MADLNGPLTEQQVKNLRDNGRPLFNLGRIVATPAALMHLHQNGIPARSLLKAHRHGCWGTGTYDDAVANDRALLDGSRILSTWEIDGENVWIVTEALDDSGLRSTTTILMAREY